MYSNKSLFYIPFLLPVATVFAEVNDILVKEAEPVIQTLQAIES